MTHNDMISWFERNKNRFSVEMNGYSSLPLDAYLSTLPLINKDGKIADIGCGNGMLLKFVMDFSGHNLIPYGIDIKESPIENLVSEVLSEYKENFSVKDAMEYDFSSGPFDIIISSPAYAGRNGLEFTRNCIDNLKSGGRLIFRLHRDILKKYDEGRFYPHYRNLGMDISEGVNIRFCTYDKK